MKKLGTSLFVVCALAVAGWSLQQSPITPAQQKPAAKRPPQAKSQAEYKDYNTAYAITGGAAMEKAANDFAARYPQSELTAYLYSKAMHEYQNENQPDKMLTMGEKVLSLDPDNSIALVLTPPVPSPNPTQTNPRGHEQLAVTQ